MKSIAFTALLFLTPAALAQAPAPKANQAKATETPTAPVLNPNVCIPVDGMTFELAGPETFLVKKGKESVALVRVGMFLPAGISSMRFMSNEICQNGTKSSLIVNEMPYTVQSIRRYSEGGQVRNATINAAGTAATVGDQ